jgi:hypothetical protein
VSSAEQAIVVAKKAWSSVHSKAQWHQMYAPENISASEPYAAILDIGVWFVFGKAVAGKSSPVAHVCASDGTASVGSKWCNLTSRWFRLATAKRRCSRHSGGVRPQMTSVILKFEAIAFLLAFLVADFWFVTFRCSASPDINLFHLGFGIVVQLLVVGVPLFVIRIYPEADDKTNLSVVAFALILGLVSYPMVRDSILFGDSVDAERTSNSKGFLCPGARNTFPFGHRQWAAAQAIAV